MEEGTVLEVVTPRCHPSQVKTRDEEIPSRATFRVKIPSRRPVGLRFDDVAGEASRDGFPATLPMVEVDELQRNAATRAAEQEPQPDFAVCPRLPFVHPAREPLIERVVAVRSDHGWISM